MAKLAAAGTLRGGVHGGLSTSGLQEPNPRASFELLARSKSLNCLHSLSSLETGKELYGVTPRRLSRLSHFPLHPTKLHLFRLLGLHLRRYCNSGSASLQDLAWILINLAHWQHTESPPHACFVDQAKSA